MCNLTDIRLYTYGGNGVLKKVYGKHHKAKSIQDARDSINFMAERKAAMRIRVGRSPVKDTTQYVLIDYNKASSRIIAIIEPNLEENEQKDR